MRPRVPIAPHIALALALALTGCAAGGDGVIASPLGAPEIRALSSTSIAVGEELRFEGDGFPEPDEGWVDVTLEGEFVPLDGSAREPVDITLALAPNASGEVIWRSFGSHRVPFGTGDQLGRFEGYVHATSRYFDGNEVPQRRSSWMLATLDVAPSVIVRDFRAVGETFVADCAEPAPNAINLVPYGMRVDALGFTPVEAEFRISQGLVVDGSVSTDATVVAATPEDGQAAALMQFAPVPALVDGYGVTIQVDLVEESGERHSLVYPVTVRRPLQVYFTEPMQVAQTYEPDPVSGCIPGGIGGLATTYAESHSETRTRSITHTETRGWEQTYGIEHSETYGTSRSVGGSESATHATTATDTRTSGGSVVSTDMFSATTGLARTNHVDYSATSSDSYGWSVNDEHFSEINGEVGAEAGGSLFGLINIGGSAKGGFVDGNRSSYGQSGSRTNGSGVEAGESGTASASASESHSRAVGAHWEQSQSYAETNSFTRTATWENTQSYSEAESHSETVAMSLGESDSETYSVSTTDAESLHTSGTVYAGLMGMWYRQTTRLARYGTVVAYDLCGNGTAVGHVMLDDWTWAPDLALGAECPPATNFPPADCLIEPCDGL